MAEGAPLLREYVAKSASRVRIPPTPPVTIHRAFGARFSLPTLIRRLGARLAGTPVQAVGRDDVGT